MRGRTFVTRIKNMSGPTRDAVSTDAAPLINQEENDVTTLDHPLAARRDALARLTAAVAARDAADLSLIHISEAHETLS